MSETKKMRLSRWSTHDPKKLALVKRLRTAGGRPPENAKNQNDLLTPFVDWRIMKQTKDTELYVISTTRLHPPKYKPILVSQSLVKWEIVWTRKLDNDFDTCWPFTQRCAEPTKKLHLLKWHLSSIHMQQACDDEIKDLERVSSKSLYLIR